LREDSWVVSNLSDIGICLGDNEASINDCLANFKDHALVRQQDIAAVGQLESDREGGKIVVRGGVR
jgi:hypothetical protein